MKRVLDGGEARRRSALISALGVVSLLLLALTIFAVASQARTLTSSVEQAVQTGENLRVVSVARAELSVASRISGTSPDQVLVIEGAIENAEQALTAVGENLDSSTPDAVVDAFAQFESTADAQIEQIREEPEDLDAAQDAEFETGEAFTVLAEALRSEQVASINGLESGNDLMNLTATIATFVVAFVVPSMGLLIFQALRSAPREQRKLAFEYDRLERQSNAMATRVGKEASTLRSEISESQSKLDRGKISRSLLRFESIASFNGSATSIRNESLLVNDVVVAAIEQVDAASLVSVDRSGHLRAIGDREQLSMVIAELISNAIAHGATPIRTYVRDAGPNVELHVVDTGPGLSKEVVAALIDESEFELREASGVGTYGFGLIAARRSLEAMGGDLRHKRSGSSTHLIASLPIDHSQSNEDKGEFPHAA